MSKSKPALDPYDLSVWLEEFWHSKASIPHKFFLEAHYDTLVTLSIMLQGSPCGRFANHALFTDFDARLSARRLTN